MMAEIDEVAYHPPYIAVKGTGKKLIVYCVYTTRIFPIPEFNVLESTATLVDRVYPNGYQESIVRSYEGVVEI